MVIVKCNPTSPGRRHVVKVVQQNLYHGRPFQPLIQHNSKSGGRNNLGRITMRHIGGRHKRMYRIIDFKRTKDNIYAKIERLEYDPNRSSNIFLILYEDGTRNYILAPKGLLVGSKIISGEKVPIQIGNSLPIKNIPTGTLIHNIEIKIGKGGQIARTAGSSAQIIAYEGSYVSIRLRSGEIRRIDGRCRATVGEVGNSEHMLQMLGKAGSSRWRGIRPTVRGTAMNPIDHPHGGGEGRNFGKHPVTPWGQQTKGKKTRKNKRTEKFILRNRNYNK
ncbi:50S ribosomal protein L2 [Buchnera aphidicola (Takecallis arundicolens)]|uniref:50S ribosomal protein L2 n=1 Tax=Buchnera aphidicola TaxID=9 RepID=UPI003464C7E7